MADSMTNAPAGITKRGAAPPIQKVFDIAPERGRAASISGISFSDFVVHTGKWTSGSISNGPTI
jgi:hypothetical protein